MEPGQTIKVGGALVATGTGSEQRIVLASILLDSYPPQPAGATLTVEGLDLDSIVGLNSTVAQPELAVVTWSDFWVVLDGEISEGILRVKEVPQVIETAAADIRVRFSPVSEPMASGDTVWWVFDVKNDGSSPLELTFSSGQKADVVLSQAGVQKYRWSDGKAFDQAIQTVTVEPGGVLPVVLNDTLQVAAGEYEVTATISATKGGETGGEPLPPLTGRITIFGSGQGSGSTTTSAAQSDVLSIEEALLAKSGSTIRVRGSLVASGSGPEAQMVLASALAESYPPQAGGATLELVGLDLEDLVGLSSTADRPEVAPVTWSDYWMVLGGVIRDGVLEVRQTPRVASAEGSGVTVRFSPVSEPIASGDTAWWAFDLRNDGDKPLKISFSSSQQADVVLAQNGVEKYRWSAGKGFTENVVEVTIEPGKRWSTVLNDTLGVPSGDYELAAIITVGVIDGSPTQLPQVTTTIHVD